MTLQLGRRSPKNAPALMFSNFATGIIPAHPATVNNLIDLSGWEMLGNDVAGDCNAVTWANFRRIMGAPYPTQEQVWQFYKTQNPTFDPNGTADGSGPGSAADEGMEIQSSLEYLQKHGGPDGVKAVAFAKVDHTNAGEVQAALAIFGGLWLGITVLDANMDEFAKSQAWTDPPGSHVDGGHAILAGGYTPNIRFVTWGKEAEFGPSFWNGWAAGSPLVDEAWVVIWPEHLGSKQFQAGVDTVQLAADYRALTGRTLPLPTPEPPPAPPTPITPPPTSGTTPDAADVALRGVALPWTAKRHIGSNAAMAKALKEWLNIKLL